MQREDGLLRSGARRSAAATTLLSLMAPLLWSSAAAETLPQLSIVPNDPSFSGAAAAASSRRYRPPNFLYILSDDLGYGEISISPGRRNFNLSTPNIDRLFMSGMRFTDFYANSECAPSRGAIMTGRHTGHATIRDNQFEAGLTAADTTFLDVLREQGDYETSCIGKWDLSGGHRKHSFNKNPEGAPWNHGCGRFFGGELWSWFYPTERVYRYDEDSGLREIKIPMNEGASRERCMAPGNSCVWLTDLNLQEALSELEYHKARQDAEAAEGYEPSPFFMYLAFSDPHLGSWSDSSRLLLNNMADAKGNPVPSIAEFAGKDWPPWEKDHAAAIVSYHDAYVGAIIDKLDELGLGEDTVVIYSSDNGAADIAGDAHKIAFFESSGPLQGYKQWLTEGGIRVPAAIRWPGKIAAGTVSNEPLALWDLFPTILDIAGVPREEWPAGIDGVSIWEGVLQQQPATIGSHLVVPSASFSHPPLYFETCGAGHTRPSWSWPRVGTNFMRAIRVGRYKGLQIFMEGRFSEMRLYDVVQDVGETTDLSSIYPEIAENLRGLMNSPGMRTETVASRNYSATDDCGNTYGRLIWSKKKEGGANSFRGLTTS